MAKSIDVRPGGQTNLPSKDPDSKKTYSINLANYLGSETLSAFNVTPDTGMTVSGVTNTTTVGSFFIDAGATVGWHTLIVTWSTTAGVINETAALKIQVVEAENAPI